MRDNELQFDRTCHVLYSKPCKKQCDKWGDYRMYVAPYDKDQPIYYEFTTCPAAEFAKEHGLLEVMPALCNPILRPWS